MISFSQCEYSKKRIDTSTTSPHLCSMKTSNQHYQIVESAIRYIVENQREQPNLDEISQHIHLSKFHLQRIFKEWAGVTPKAFLQLLTIEQSKKLLRLGQSTLETSYEVGLSGNGRLHDLFVKYESCTPGEFKSQGEGMKINWAITATCFGDALIAETSRGVCKVAFVPDRQQAFDDLAQEYPQATFVESLGKNGQLLKKYFEDWEVPKEKINVFFKGTPFQIQVWRALLEIPSAQLCSYQDIGHKIGRPKAVRAIGSAIGKNPIAYLIPCHRVIKSDGKIGNYRWQTERKMAINAFEQLQLS